MSPIDLFDDFYEDPDSGEILFSADITIEQLNRFCSMAAELEPGLSRRRIDGGKTFVLFLLEEECSYLDGPSEEEQEMIEQQVEAIFQQSLLDLIMVSERDGAGIRGPFEESLFTADISVGLIERFCQLVCASHSAGIAREELEGARQLLILMLDDETQFSTDTEDEDTERILERLEPVFKQYIHHLGGLA